MIDAQNLVVLLSLIFSAFCLWYGLFWLYRDYSIDVFRQKMFALRDQLFDEADQGLIEFSHPAYGVLRNTMNGFLRFGHRIGIFELLVNHLIFNKKKDPKLQKFSFSERWEKATSTLPSEARERLEFYRVEMAKLLLTHLFLRSPSFIVFVIIPSVVLVVPIVAYVVLRQQIKRATENLIRSPMEDIESTALAYGK